MRKRCTHTSVVRWARAEVPPSLRTSSRHANEPALEPAARSSPAWTTSTRASASSRFARATSKRRWRSFVETAEISLPELTWIWTGERNWTFWDVTTSAGSAGVVFTSANSAGVNLWFFGAVGGKPRMLPDESLMFCIDTSYSDGGALNPVGFCAIASCKGTYPPDVCPGDTADNL